MLKTDSASLESALYQPLFPQKLYSDILFYPIKENNLHTIYRWLFLIIDKFFIWNFESF